MLSVSIFPCRFGRIIPTWGQQPCGHQIAVMFRMLLCGTHQMHILAECCVWLIMNFEFWTMTETTSSLMTHEIPIFAKYHLTSVIYWHRKSKGIGGRSIDTYIGSGIQRNLQAHLSFQKLNARLFSPRVTFGSSCTLPDKYFETKHIRKTSPHKMPHRNLIRQGSVGDYYIFQKSLPPHSLFLFLSCTLTRQYDQQSVPYRIKNFQQ